MGGGDCVDVSDEWCSCAEWMGLPPSFLRTMPKLGYRTMPKPGYRTPRRWFGPVLLRLECRSVAAPKRFQSAEKPWNIPKSTSPSHRQIIAKSTALRDMDAGSTCATRGLEAKLKTLAAKGHLDRRGLEAVRALDGKAEAATQGPLTLMRRPPP